MDKSLYLRFLIRSKFNFKIAKLYSETYYDILKLGLFDKEFYLDSYSNVKDSKMDPLEHFLFYGFEEGKYPGPFFNIFTYMEKHPKIKINPLVHYVLKNSKGHMITDSPAKNAKERLIETNFLFLNNYEFDSEPLVSIIILNRNGSNHLKRLFKDFHEKINYNNYEIIVVDNNSNDDSVEILNEFSKNLPIKIIQNKENVSFSKGNNDAAKIANGEYLLLLNNDMEPTFAWLSEMVGTILNNDNVGAVGAKLVFPYEYNRHHKAKSFTIQHAGVKFFEANNAYIYSPYHDLMLAPEIFDSDVNTPKECISNTAATLLVPKKVYFDLDGLDENYFYGYEDVDFAFKLYNEGYKTLYCPSALLFHHESATRLNSAKAEEINFNNIMYFKKKWDDFLFKNLLNDKIEENNFFTDEKLAITIVSKDISKEYISNLSKTLIYLNYNVKVISDAENFDLGSATDILLSFDPEYELNKVVARLNLIKILFLEKYDENLENFNEYDIILSSDNAINTSSLKNNLFYVDKSKNSGEVLVNILKKFYNL